MGILMKMKEEYDPREGITVELRLDGDRYFYGISDERMSGPESARLITKDGVPAGLAQREGDNLECVFMSQPVKLKLDLPLDFEGQTIDHYVIGREAGKTTLEFYNKGKQISAYDSSKGKNDKGDQGPSFGDIISQLRIVLDPKYYKKIMDEMKKPVVYNGKEVKSSLYESLCGYLVKVKNPEENLTRESVEVYFNQMAQNPEYQGLFGQLRRFLIDNSFMDLDENGNPIVGENQEVGVMKDKIQAKDYETIGARDVAPASTVKIKNMAVKIEKLRELIAKRRKKSFQKKDYWITSWYLFLR